jgi:peptide/nickel transport system permease protein
MDGMQSPPGLLIYLAARGGRFLLGLFIVSLLHFALPRLMPGSPVFAILGPAVVGMSRKAYTDLESELGLHDPLFVQLARHFNAMVRLDFGHSYHFQQPVKQVLKAHIPPTLALLLPAVFLSAILACLLGAAAGRFPGRLPDHLLTPLFLFLYATPAFLLAMVCLDLFAFRLDLFPLGGLRRMDAGPGFGARILDVGYHLFLPIMVLALSSTAVKFLVMRNSVMESGQQAFVLYARARGIPEYKILFTHILRHASLPFVSLVGLQFAFILSGSLLIEIVFSINGMGSLIHEAAMNRDYPVLQASFLVLTLVVLSVNMLTDMVYGLLDPRVRA